MKYPVCLRATFAVWLLCGMLLGLSACDNDSSSSTDDDDATTGTPQPTPEPSPSPTPTSIFSDLHIISSTPGKGAMAVPWDTAFTLLFSAPLTADLSTLTVTVTDQDGTVTTLEDPSLDSDGKTLTYLGFGLRKNSDFMLDVLFEETDTQRFPPANWPLTYQAQFTTRIPCGISFNIAEQVGIEQLGGNQGIVGLLNDTLAASALNPVGLMFVDVLTDVQFPASELTVASGLCYPSKEPGEEGLYQIDDDFGLPVTMTGCAIDASGAFTCGPQTFVFPIPITDTTVLNLYISQAVVSGNMAVFPGNEDVPDYVMLSDFQLAGVITDEDIARIAQETGLTQIIETLLVLDVDLDGDGNNDAATAVAVSQPGWIQFVDCDPFAEQLSSKHGEKAGTH